MAPASGGQSCGDQGAGKRWKCKEAGGRQVGAVVGEEAGQEDVNAFVLGIKELKSEREFDNIELFITLQFLELIHKKIPHTGDKASLDRCE